MVFTMGKNIIINNLGTYIFKVLILERVISILWSSKKNWRIAWSPIGLLPKLENNGKQWITIAWKNESGKTLWAAPTLPMFTSVSGKVRYWHIYIMSYSWKKVVIYSCIKEDSEFFGYQQIVHMYNLQTFYLTSPFSSQARNQDFMGGGGC